MAAFEDEAAAIEFATDVASLTAALDEARKVGMTNKDPPYKDGKKRLYALEHAIDLDDMPRESARYAKRRLAPGEVTDETFETANKKQKTNIKEGVKSAKEGNPDYTVFVCGLSKTSKVDDVQKLFNDCGEVETFHMPLHTAAKKKRQPKGYALIAYANRQGMKKALGLNGKELEGSKLTVERKKDKDQVEITKKEPTEREFEVFVGGVFSVSEEAVRNKFSMCGEIEAFDMPLTPKGQFKGIAFIAYKDKLGMEKALALHETAFHKKTLTVERKVPKESRAVDAPKGKGTGKSSLKTAADEQAPELSKYGGNVAKLTGSIVKATGTKKDFDSDEE